MVDSLHFRMRSPLARGLSAVIRDFDIEIQVFPKDYSQPPSPTLSVVDGYEAVLEQRLQ